MIITPHSRIKKTVFLNIYTILCSLAGCRAGMNVAIESMIINTQDMFAAGMLAFSSFTGSNYAFDKGSFLEIIKGKRLQKFIMYASIVLRNKNPR